MHALYWALPAVVLAAACTKNTNENEAVEVVEKQTLLVVEKETAKPIAGATVRLQKCAQYDPEFGCTRYAAIRSLTTNDSGIVTFSSALNVAQIEVEHYKYWAAYGNSNPVVLTPVATIKATIKQVSLHPKPANLALAAHMSGCVYPCMPFYQQLGTPADTVVYFKALGYTENQLSWYTTRIANPDSMFQTAPFYISGMDTAYVTVNY